MKSIAVIVVNYNSPGGVVAFCQRVRDISGKLHVAIAVTDNSSCFVKPENGKLLQALSELNVGIHDPSSNLGYFPGAAFTYDRLIASGEQPDFVVVANTDIWFPDKAFFSDLAQKEYPDEFLAIGPNIEFGLGTKRIHQNPLRLYRFSAKRFFFQKMIYRYRTLSMINAYFASLRRNAPQLPHSMRQPQPVYMIHGCFMIFTRQFFEETAGLKFPSFLYGEEIYVAEEVRCAGKATLYDPSLTVIHAGGETTSLMQKTLQDQYVYDSLKILYERYFMRRSDPGGSLKRNH